MKQLFAALMLISLSALAVEKGNPCAVKGTDLPFPKGKKIQIVAYDKETSTFEIQSPEFPGEGTSFITFETLLDGVKWARDHRGDIVKKPDDIVDSVYMTEKALPTLFERERKARVVCGTLK